ncbi:hypothetical protein DB32_002673 [Sandaracinus amylolyticus]|uniref:Uncharacterized protein n=1 Tax=Sandaracinus amylolyticus TaxID=927083 RepID=A0A0F6SEN9_9BACT|nr:hypothetical protein DB32_002673 [Sandaracinus amylolyticus]
MALEQRKHVLRAAPIASTHRHRSEQHGAHRHRQQGHPRSLLRGSSDFPERFSSDFPEPPAGMGARCAKMGTRCARMGARCARGRPASSLLVRARRTRRVDGHAHRRGVPSPPALLRNSRRASSADASRRRARTWPWCSSPFLRSRAARAPALLDGWRAVCSCERPTLRSSRSELRAVAGGRSRGGTA